jgi:vanillate O-demethylase ferredoxin subunit
VQLPQKPMSQAWNTLRVDRKSKEADDVVSFELVDPNGGPLLAFSAGSHVDVEVAPGLIRQYSLCNDPRDRGRYQIGVLREPASRGGSIGLIDNVAAGSLLRVSDPRNHFELDASAARVVLVAGGIGITPILCMAERLAHTSVPFEMHYCARSRSRAAFCDRIESSAFVDKVSFHFGDEDNRIDLESAFKTCGSLDHLYVCGPKGFVDVVLKAAAKAGWPEDRLHREFFTPAEDLVRADDGGFEVEIASTGARIAVAADRTVLDVLLANGVDLPASCEQGVCGTCVTRVLQGTPDHRDMFLTDAEHARNDQFTPCCSRSKSDLLVLDL